VSVTTQRQRRHRADVDGIDDADPNARERRPDGVAERSSGIQHSALDMKPLGRLMSTLAPGLTLAKV
jgi:hypothetical protein